MSDEREELVLGFDLRLLLNELGFVLGGLNAEAIEADVHSTAR